MKFVYLAQKISPSTAIIKDKGIDPSEFDGVWDDLSDLVVIGPTSKTYLMGAEIMLNGNEVERKAA